MYNAANKIIIFMVVFLFSCSTTKNKNNVAQQPFPGQIVDSATIPDKISKFDGKDALTKKELHELALKKTEAKFESLVELSKKSGPEAVRFISSDLYIKAVDASYRGDSWTSAFLLKFVVKLNPEEVFIKKKYAIELIRVGRMDEAKVILEETFKLTGNTDESIGLILGGIYSTIEEEDKSKEVYSKVLKYHPSSEEACIFLAKSYAKDKKYNKSFKVLKGCFRNDPKKAIFPYYIGKIAYERGHKKTARKYFKEALKVDNDYYQAVLAIGILYEEDEKLELALGVYKSFLKKSPANYAILSKLVKTLFALGKFKQIIPYAEVLSSIDPSDLNLKVKLGILYTDDKRFDDAKGVFKEILQEVPDSDKVLYYLGALHQETGEVEQAISYFTRIPSESVLFHEGHIKIGDMLLGKAINDHDKGITEGIDRFTKYIVDTSAKYPNIKLDLYITLAGFYERQLDFKRAIETINGLSQEKDYNYDHVQYLASLYEKDNQRPKAISIIEGVIEKDPDSFDAKYYLASLYEKSQRSAEAIVLVETILVKDPENSDASYYLASLYEKNKERKKAIDVMEKVLKKNSKNADALNFIGYTLLEGEKSYKKAYQYIKKAVKLKPNDGYIRDSLGWYYYKIGSYKKALRELKKAWELVKTDVVINKHLALIYYKLNKFDQSNEFFAEALKNCKKDSEKIDILKTMEGMQNIRLPASIEEKPKLQEK